MMTITRRPLLQRLAAFTCGSAIVFGAGLARPLADTDKVVAVRYEDRFLGQLAEQGLARSATLRSLVAQLEHTQVIVFAAISRDMDGGVGGRVRFVGNGQDGWRFLRIELDDRRTKLEVLAMLGHELQHAVEIAGVCDVVDPDSMAALYDRIGFPSAGMRQNAGTSRDYETQAAIDTEKRVYSELFGNHW
jgi:hypothetical protein